MYRIILDTDPGIDDALTIFLALASPEIHLEAITTVSGNVHVDLTTRNALALLELAGRTGIPVARGCSHPLVRQPVTAAYVHGHNGLGEVELPAHRPHPGHFPIDIWREDLPRERGGRGWAVMLSPFAALRVNSAQHLSVRRARPFPFR